MSVVTLDRHSFPSVLNVRVDGRLRRYVPERKCNDVAQMGEIFQCSECGSSVEVEYGDSHIYVGDLIDDISYCPNCGAKVVVG